MTDPYCSRFDGLAPEVALGTLDGRERAEAFDHLRHCARCRRLLDGYNQVADGLVELVPAAEPSPGFETRVLAAVAAGTPTRRSSIPARRRQWIARATVAAALAVVIGLAGFGLGNRSRGADRLRHATLSAAGHPVGSVYLYAGDHSWLYMGVRGAAVNGTVTC